MVIQIFFISLMLDSRFGFGTGSNKALDSGTGSNNKGRIRPTLHLILQESKRARQSPPPNPNEDQESPEDLGRRNMDSLLALASNLQQQSEQQVKQREQEQQQHQDGRQVAIDMAISMARSHWAAAQAAAQTGFAMPAPPPPFVGGAAAADGGVAVAAAGAGAAAAGLSKSARRQARKEHKRADYALNGEVLPLYLSLKHFVRLLLVHFYYFYLCLVP